MSTPLPAARKELLLLLEVLWGQDVALGVEGRCPRFAPQLEFVQLSQLPHRPDAHLVLPVLVHEDGSAAEEGQEAVRTHPGGRGDGGLCRGAAVGPGVRQPAPHVAIVGPVGPGGEGGGQTAHIQPRVKAPGVLGGVLPRVDESAARLGLDLRAGRRLQGQPVVGLRGEAGPLLGLTGEEELTLSPRLVGQQGLAGMGHLGRDKREPGGPLCLSLPGVAAETTRDPGFSLGLWWPGRKPCLHSCPAVRSSVCSVEVPGVSHLLLSPSVRLDFPPPLLSFCLPALHSLPYRSSPLWLPPAPARNW